MCPGRTDPSASFPARPCHPGRSAVREAPPRPACDVSRIWVRQVNIVATKLVHCSVQLLSIQILPVTRAGQNRLARSETAMQVGRTGKNEERKDCQGYKRPIDALGTCRFQNPDIPQAGHFRMHGRLAGRGRAGLGANKIVCLTAVVPCSFHRMEDTSLERLPGSTNKRNLM